MVAMRVILGSGNVPVIYAVPHASHDFNKFDDRVALTQEQKERFSDYGTGVTAPTNGIVAIIAEHSRALGDCNRDADDAGRFQDQDYGKAQAGGKHDIWKPGQGLTDEEKQWCDDNLYVPFRQEIFEQLKKRADPTFLVCWHNTAHYEIGENEAGEQVIMKPFILSNRGAEESFESNGQEQTSCDPVFMTLLRDAFIIALRQHDLPDEVHMNLVYRGGSNCRMYSSHRNPESLVEKGIVAFTQSLQLEYDTILTHDQQTLEFYPDKAAAIQAAFTQAIEQAIAEYK